MKNRSLHPLLGLIFVMVLLFLSVELSGFRASGGGLLSIPTASITFGTAYILYAGSFSKVEKSQKKLQIFISRWFRDVLMLSGIFGAIIGATIMSIFFAGGSSEALGAGLSASLVSPLYGLFGAISFYFIEKHIDGSKEGAQIQSYAIKSGLNIRSILSLLTVVIMLIAAIGISVAMVSYERWNILGLFFSLPIAYFFAAVVIASIYVFDGKRIVQAFVVPFFRTEATAADPRKPLKVIRSLKRIVSLVGLVAAAGTPIFMLARYGGEITAMLMPLGKAGIVLFWSMFTLLFLYLAEGQLVQQVYNKTGEIHYDDRFFIVKFVLPSFLIIFFSLWLAFLFQVFT